jgi:uncharacterized membrane protein YbaN (DUF454 family)
MLVAFVVISSILWRFDTFYGYLVYFSGYGMLCQENSGNPAIKTHAKPRIILITSNFTDFGKVYVQKVPYFLENQC